MSDDEHSETSIIEDDEMSSSSEAENNDQEQSTSEPLVSGDGKILTKRLIIQKMVMTNFKSYAGEREIGPFHKVC